MNNTENIQNEQERLEQILRVSGSSAMNKNTYNVTVINSEDSTTSLLFKSLQKDKFDEDEIKKAINVEIKELKPNIPQKRKDLVPKPVYDAEVKKVEDLTELVRVLREQIAELQNRILTLQSEVDNEKTNRLNVELTNDALVNQLDALSDTVDDFGQQLATAIQKSVEESIYRTSLQAQNDGFKAQIQALIKQIDSLNAIIEGLQAQLGALQQQKLIEDSADSVASASGGKVVNDVVAVSMTQKSDPGNKYEIFAKFNASSKGSNKKWINGGTLKFNNSDKAAVQVTLKFTKGNQGGNWLKLEKTSFTIDAAKSVDIKMDLSREGLGGLESRWHKRVYGGHWGHSKVYPGGTLLVTVKRADGTTKEPVSFSCGFGKYHPKSY